MSICNEGWDVDEPNCPCYRKIKERKDGAGECKLRITVIYDDEKDCSYASILKLLMVAKEVKEWDELTFCEKDSNDWQCIDIWIRR